MFWIVYDKTTFSKVWTNLNLWNLFILMTYASAFPIPVSYNITPMHSLFTTKHYQFIYLTSEHQLIRNIANFLIYLHSIYLAGLHIFIIYTSYSLPTIVCASHTFSTNYISPPSSNHTFVSFVVHQERSLFFFLFFFI